MMNNILPLLISTVVFVGIITLVFVVFFRVRSYLENHLARKKIEKYSLVASPELPRSTAYSINTPSEGGIFFRIKQACIKFIQTLGISTKPKHEKEISTIEKSLMFIGYRNRGTVPIFYGTKILCAVWFFIVAFSLKFFVHKPVNLLPLLFFVSAPAVAGYYMPDIWLRIKSAKRKELLWKGIPDAIDLLVICVEAGMGLDAAINRVGEEMKFSNMALSKEFKLFNCELRLGVPRPEALRNLARRIGQEEMNRLITLLIQVEKLGTNIAKALRVQSNSMRTKRYQKAEEAAAKLSVKLLFPVIMCIFPSIFIVILGPALIQIYRFFNG